MRGELLVDFAGVRDQETLDRWLVQLASYTERYAHVPGYAGVRAEALYGMGAVLTKSANNFWKDAGIKLLRDFLQEQPEDRARGYRATVHLVVAGRWHGHPTLLLPYLEEDPGRAREPGAKEAVLAFHTRSYDLDDAQSVAARELLWTYWGEEVDGTLRTWLLRGKDRERLNAWRILQDADRLTDEEADAVLAWVLLQKGSGYEDEFLLALDHWSELLRQDETRAKARAAVAVPGPLREVGALGRGGAPLRSRPTSAEAWCAVVGRCFHDQVERVVRRAVTDSRYPSERAAARALLARRDALAPGLAARSYLVGMRQWSRKPTDYVPDEVREGVAHFTHAGPGGVHDVAAVMEVLAEMRAVAGDKIAALEKNEHLAGGIKRQRTKAWRDFETRVEAAEANLSK